MIHMDLITLGGGCFWCTEAVFKRLKGVTEAISGYAGEDSISTPNYDRVSAGNTKFVEAVQIKFDPEIISVDRILEIFWATHDPTTVNRQGNDVGTQYRSVIFYHDEDQKNIAEKSKLKVQESGQFKDNIVTKIELFTKFYSAENYHQNYYETYKFSNPYCRNVITPKIQKIIRNFNEDVKPEFK